MTPHRDLSPDPRSTPFPEEPSRAAIKILLVDRDKEIFATFQRLFDGHRRSVVWATSKAEAIECLRTEEPTIALLDVRTATSDGLDVLSALRAVAPDLPIIAMTAYGTAQTAIEAMKRGAADVVLKPFKESKVLDVVERAIAEAREKVSDRLYVPMLSDEDFAQGLVGKSDAMQSVYKKIGRVASSDVTVLITGERGTGKELVARAIYRNSSRSNRAFLAVNCSAVPELQLEAELFGYEKGAFAGASVRKIGKVELCDGGTLFLEEVGDLTASSQAKLLRLLEEGTFDRLGATTPSRADVRIIATTHRRLEDEVAAGRFRPDLYYRLKVVQVELPPLRERHEDIPLLAEYILRRLDQAAGQDPAIQISEGAMEKLIQAEWEGNVRQLENLLHHVYFTRSGNTILPADIDLPQSTMGREAAASGGIGATAIERAGTPGSGAATSGDALTASETSSAAAASPSSASFFEAGAHHGSAGWGPEMPDPNATEEEFEDFLIRQLEPVFRAIVDRRRFNSKASPLDEVERVLVRRALNETNGNQVRAARMLGMSRATLRKRIERFDIVIERLVR